MQESFKIPSATFPSQTGNIVTFNSQYAGLPLKSHKVDITSQSGVSAINISATGINLFNKATVTLGKMLTNTGAEHNSPNASYSDYIPIVTSIPYYFSHIIGLVSFYSMCVYDENKTFIGYINIQGGKDTSGTITFTQGSYIRVNIHQTYLDICQVELGSTQTDYEPFGTYTTINIGQTVNEGEYDARTGILEVTLPSVQTIQLPPCPIDVLEGQNNIFSDVGNSSISYIKLG